MQILVDSGWSLKDDVWQDLAVNTNVASLQDLVLDIDLRKAGKGALPDDVARADAKLVKGPHVLQVVACDDVAQPSKGVAGSSKQRVLRLKLTDGKTTCKAVETRPLPNIDPESLAPGTKVCISNASVKAGLLLLDPKCLKVLGGRVAELQEAWEFQRKYGAGAARSVDAADAAAAERPPPFQTFIPGKTRPPRRPTTATDADSDAPTDRVGHAARAGVPPQQQRNPGPAPSRAPAGIAPPPGFDPLPEAMRPEPEGAAAVYTAPSGPLRASTARREESEAGPAMGGPALGGPGGGVPGRAGPSAAAKAKLQERLAASEEGSRGRGMQRGRGRRRGRFHEEEESGMTLDEWEAQQKSKAAGGLQLNGGQGQVLSDEELARQLQQQLDMEDSLHDHSFQEQPRSAVDDLKASLFAYERPAEDMGYQGRGRRGRGRGRGRY
ncbi:probable Tudor domain-containing protein 3 at N-terminal half [Coccomyxa sp. Obi]|nr:probable Tudor domain-containing protein 3 at N-terminal half [Coccomyxa sp. Obi]